MSKKVTIPLRNYRDRRGGRVPEGTYLAITEDVELGKTKNGDDMLTLYFRVLGGEFDGTTIIDRLFPAMEKAQWRTVAFLQAAGIPTPRKDFVIELDKLKNRKMDITVEDGTPYNGSVRSEVRGYAKVAKGAASDDVEDIVEDEDVSDDPTDYDEDLEPEKVAKATAKKAASVPEADDDVIEEVNDPDMDDIDLDDIDEVS